VNYNKDYKIKKILFEILYFFNESHQYQEVDTHLDSMLLLYNKIELSKLIPKDNMDSNKKRDIYRTIFGSCDNELFSFLEKRYYPEMVDVNGDTFMMGAKDSIRGVLQSHKVKISGFQIAKTETTYWQYKLFCVANKKELRYTGWPLEGDNPAVNVNFYNAVEYSNWVSKQQNLPLAYFVDKTIKDTFSNKNKNDNIGWTIKNQPNNIGYRLPYESEWEYAARGGHNQVPYIYSGSNNVDEVAWYSSYGGIKTKPVARKKPNSLGLFDLSGNAWEWCWDWYATDYYSKSEQTNPQGPGIGISKVLRGGSWGYGPSVVKVDTRAHQYLDHEDFYTGFRLAKSKF
jgi:formylglycine-generating enzyme required for sulfatase activity